VVRDLVFDAQTAKPSIGQIQFHFLAQSDDYFLDDEVVSFITEEHPSRYSWDLLRKNEGTQ
jgi:hypothetical protein